MRREKILKRRFPGWALAYPLLLEYPALYQAVAVAATNVLINLESESCFAQKPNLGSMLIYVATPQGLLTSLRLGSLVPVCFLSSLLETFEGTFVDHAT